MQKRISLETIFFIIFGFVFLEVIPYEFTIVPLYDLHLFLFITAGILYLLVDRFEKKEGAAFYPKLAIILATILVMIGSVSATIITSRHQSEPHRFVHDNVLQIEAGLKFLTERKNPYSENYLATPLADWFYYEDGAVAANPSLYHVITLPSHLYLSLPWYLLSTSALGWYDQRFVYLTAYALTLLILYLLTPKKQDKLLALIVFGFNPIFLGDFIHGTNDILPFALIAASLLFLTREKYKTSAFFLALTVTTKQSAWFILPFYFLFLYYQGSGHLRERLKSILRKTLPFFLTAGILVIPFLLWDATAFIDDVYRYPAGGLPTSYPIKGFGIGFVIKILGLVSGSHDVFPFWILQAAIGIPLFVLLAKKQRQENTVRILILNSAVFLVIFWYFSRFFVGNYVAFISNLLILAYFTEDKPRSSQE